ncbi:hypothetical protein [Microbacterium sp. NPDC057944]|uniref:COG4705 family protein n=1 Tax=Microbacterium sp. NPDC057944 TaxID=3346286 RepID=UPI0036DF0663
MNERTVDMRPRRVPEITIGFWIAKAASTALGEAASDFSIRAMPPVLAVLLGFVLFVAALLWQLSRGRYVPAVYWTTVAMVGVFGTMAADAVHVVLGLPYVLTTIVYAVALTLVFLLWWRVEGTLSVHEVTTRRRELFYWSAVVATFALGTAAGDLAAIGLQLGYLPSILLFGILILIPALGFRLLRWSPVFSFWAAYVLTRPLGASVADWLGKPNAEGGMGMGSGWVAIGTALVMILTVAITSRSRTALRTASG